MNILITGGASGLGAAITAKLASEPSNKVYFTYCNSKKAADDLTKKLENTKALQVDFKSESSIQSLTEWVRDSDLQVLVNNAIAKPINQKHFHSLDPSNFLEGFTFNILPSIKITQAAIKLFRKKSVWKNHHDLIILYESAKAHRIF